MLLKHFFSSFIVIVLTAIALIEVSFAASDKSEIQERQRRDYLLRKHESLRFGKIVPSEHGVGSVIIDPRTGNKTLTGDIFDLGGDFSAAVFEIRARQGSQFNVTFPSEVNMRPKDHGTSLRNLTIWPEGVLNVGLTGRVEFNIGGSLYLSSNTEPGKYKAHIPVFVERIVE